MRYREDWGALGIVGSILSLLSHQAHFHVRVRPGIKPSFAHISSISQASSLKAMSSKAPEDRYTGKASCEFRNL
ncbi:hypothetical protein LZ30DRAFT_733689 [Colletotrichum cereale]|nr:hypothetical protein LZ30DRAFT_733689 [Colletotrichum cereale]